MAVTSGVHHRVNRAWAFGPVAARVLASVASVVAPTVVLIGALVPFDRVFAEEFIAVDTPHSTFACPKGFRTLAASGLPREELPPVLKHRRFKEMTLDEADELGIAPVGRAPQLAKVTDLARIKESARVIDLSKPGAELMNLNDGIYVWAIDGQNHLALVPRNLDPGNEALKKGAAFLGSHEGLMRLMKATFGRRTEFVSTGEIVVRNGRVLAVDNASGSYPGGSANLKYGLQKLKEHELMIDTRTVIEDHSVKSNYAPHDAAFIQAPIEFKVMNDPKLRPLFDETRRVMKRIDAKFESDEALQNYFERRGIKGYEAEAAVTLLRRWLNPREGAAYNFSEIHDRAGDAKFRETLKLLESAVNVP